jgi:NADH dehydrogenase [ubiquinone] 1 alpha subcomplex assembly factor 5
MLSERVLRAGLGRLPLLRNLGRSSPVVQQHAVCCFSTESSATHAFDRKLKMQQRDNAARAHKIWSQGSNAAANSSYDYIRQEIASRLVDRLDDIVMEDGFPLALDVGAGAGYVHAAICGDEAIRGSGGIGGVRKLVQLDSSPIMLHRDEDEAPVEGADRCESYRLVGDEEAKFPFPDGTFDLVISSASMHWVNNLPGLFKEAARVLKPDGCFMFAIIGGTTLPELRASMVMAETEREGGVSPHVGPFVELPDVGALLQRSGFALPTIDTDTFKVAFPDAPVLMEHLQRMGESNAGIKRRERVSIDTFLATACLYDEMFGLEGEDADEGREIEASVQVIYAIGWTPAPTQQQPKKRGSATARIGDVTVEHTEQTTK